MEQFDIVTWVGVLVAVLLLLLSNRRGGGYQIKNQNPNAPRPPLPQSGSGVKRGVF